MRIKVFLWMSTVFTLLVSCTGKNEQVRSGMIVKTEKTVQYSGGNGKEYAFISRPYRTSELSFRVGGPIDRFDVYSGNYYSQGSIIAEIDPRDFRIRKERTKAIYEQMKTEFDRIQKLYVGQYREPGRRGVAERLPGLRRCADVAVDGELRT